MTTARVLILLCLLASLTLCVGCTARSQAIPQPPVVIKLSPPATLYAPRPIPDLPAVLTPRTAVRYSATLLLLVGEMQEDRDAIGAWVEGRNKVNAEGAPMGKGN